MKTKNIISCILFLALFLFIDPGCKKKQDSNQVQGNQSAITKEITGLFTVTFPIGSIQTADPGITQVQDTAEESCFGVTADLFRVTAHLPYQIKINTGATMPLSDDISISWVIPEAFIQALPDSGKLLLFARLYQNGGEETLDNYTGLPGTFNSSNSTFTATLPYWIFTNTRTPDASYEAILILGANKESNQLKSLKSEPCQGDNIQCPVGSCQVNSPFNMKRLHPIDKEYKPHTGVDLQADQGSDVKAAADGVVVRIKLNYKLSAKGNPQGYGMYLVILHFDGSSTLYAHLSETDVKEGDIVSRGQVIAKSGGRAGDLWSGGSTGPHLHFEYVPFGEIIGASNNVDPFPCISDLPGKPVVETGAVDNITQTSAVAGGDVVSDGGGPVSMHGVCWNISGKPTISNWHTSDGPGLGNYSSQLTGLTPNTNYYLRAYATNETGTAYGDVTIFTTSDVAGLNGLWSTGSIVVSIQGSTGAFYKILNGMWLQALGAGFISIGSTKIANIASTSATTWSCNELWWHSTDGNIDMVGFSPDGSIVMEQDGNTFTLTSSNPWTGDQATATYSRSGLMTFPAGILNEKPGAVAGK